jgi:hypothetical protein
MKPAAILLNNVIDMLMKSVRQLVELNHYDSNFAPILFGKVLKPCFKFLS